MGLAAWRLPGHLGLSVIPRASLWKSRLHDPRAGSGLGLDSRLSKYRERPVAASVSDLHVIYVASNEYLIDADGEPIVWSD